MIVKYLTHCGAAARGPQSTVREWVIVKYLTHCGAAGMWGARRRLLNS